MLLFIISIFIGITYGAKNYEIAYGFLQGIIIGLILMIVISFPISTFAPREVKIVEEIPLSTFEENNFNFIS